MQLFISAKLIELPWHHIKIGSLLRPQVTKNATCYVRVWHANGTEL